MGSAQQAQLMATGVSIPAAPTTIANCELWLSARNIVGLSDGDPLSTWADASGHTTTRDFLGTSTSRPTYHTSGGANSQPYVDFDGGNDVMSSATNWFPTGGSAWTVGKIFIVYKVDNDPPSSGQAGAPIAGSGVGCWGSDNINGNHMPFTDSNMYCSFATSARKSMGNPTTSLTSYFCIEMLSKSGQWESRINNATTGSNYFNTGTNTVGWGADSNISIGIAGTGLQRLDGGIEEIILYSRDLTAGENTTIHTYINYYYGIVFA